MTDRPQCTHPVVNRNGTLRSCHRPATFMVHDRPDGIGRALCTYHRRHGRFRPLAWDTVVRIGPAGPAASRTGTASRRVGDAIGDRSLWSARGSVRTMVAAILAATLIGGTIGAATVNAWSEDRTARTVYVRQTGTLPYRRVVVRPSCNAEDAWSVVHIAQYEPTRVVLSCTGRF